MRRKGIGTEGTVKRAAPSVLNNDDVRATQAPIQLPLARGLLWYQ